MFTHNALLNGIRKVGSLLAGLGGTMWVLYALAYAGYGMATGHPLTETSDVQVLRAAEALFFGGMMCVSLALLSMRICLPEDLGWMGLAGLLASMLGFSAALSGLMIAATPWADVTALRQYPQMFGKCVLALFAAAVLLAMATRKGAGMNARLRWMLMAFGCGTIPAAVLIPLMASSSARYLASEAHFVAAGLLWVCIGVDLTRNLDVEARLDRLAAWTGGQAVA